MDGYVLVVGGAGYIGSQTNKILSNQGYKTIVYDNLIYGHREAVKWGELIVGDLNNIEKLRLLFTKYNITAVIHFAAFSYVGESVKNPEKYYINNVSNTLNLLLVMKDFNCKYFIFSSTCAIYGNPRYLPIDENHPQNPINPYGLSKYMVEKILCDYSKAYDIKYVALRYFNAAGADKDCEIGENHIPETHLIPLLLDAVIGKRPNIKVYGSDYDTKDGTAIRDYIHVADLAEAHTLALNYILNGGICDAFNLSNGNGYSVIEVIESVKEITNKNFKVTFTNRREGDPAVLIGDSRKARNILKWNPKYFHLETLIKTAWEWHKCKN
ncbi:UDP-glucose 4-epimerase GalE [Candidatus Neomarinimicrobiota bacterium]